MSKKLFKVGDRVRVYDVNIAGQAINFKGAITDIADDTCLIRGDDYPLLKPSAVHVKQCRRLVKKLTETKLILKTIEYRLDRLERKAEKK